MFAEQLSYLGVPADGIRRMIVTNPRRFLGLPEAAQTARSRSAQ